MQAIAINENGFDYEALANITSVDFAERVKMAFEYANKFRDCGNGCINIDIDDCEYFVQVYIVSTGYSADILYFQKDGDKCFTYHVSRYEIKHLYKLGL
ncbi:hypothetical protein, partial [Desulfocucumis palustris]|uniref:hypothetical protein n=1 Tax=Desulfocucumis palustris TaxID=1898651 RepID=UPI00105752F5